MNIPKTRRKAREMPQLVKVLVIEPDGMFHAQQDLHRERRELTPTVVPLTFTHML